jgi:hypothetical protein
LPVSACLSIGPASEFERTSFPRFRPNADLAAALMLGAAGVLMDTRFYASQESAGAPGAKERIREATGDDTLRSIVFDISRRNVWPADP